MENSNVTWSDVVGLEEAKQHLNFAVIYPIKHPQLFPKNYFDITPWSGILLDGPPGTGKTLLAKALADEAKDSTFITACSSDFACPKLIGALFQMARNKKPSIIFIDEIDSVRTFCLDKDSATMEFLIQTDDFGKENDGVVVLGTTNNPSCVNPAILKRNRIYIPLPDARDRSAMFKLHLNAIKNTLTEDEYKELGTRTEGYSGADIKNVVQNALMKRIVLPGNLEVGLAMKSNSDNVHDTKLLESEVSMNDMLQSFEIFNLK